MRAMMRATRPYWVWCLWCLFRAPILPNGETIEIPMFMRFSCVLLKKPQDGERDWVKWRSEEHTSELQSRSDLVCRLLLEKKKKETDTTINAVECTRMLHD